QRHYLGVRPWRGLSRAAANDLAITHQQRADGRVRAHPAQSGACLLQRQVHEPEVGVGSMCCLLTGGAHCPVPIRNKKTEGDNLRGAWNRAMLYANPATVDLP